MAADEGLKRPGVMFVDHDENDVLLWITAEEKDKEPFDTSLKLWNWCLRKLVKKGYVTRTGDHPQDFEVTDAGREAAAQMRGES